MAVKMLCAAGDIAYCGKKHCCKVCADREVCDIVCVSAEAENCNLRILEDEDNGKEYQTD